MVKCLYYQLGVKKTVDELCGDRKMAMCTKHCKPIGKEEPEAGAIISNPPDKGDKPPTLSKGKHLRGRPPKTPKECSECKEVKLIKAKGLCHACYQRDRSADIKKRLQAVEADQTGGHAEAAKEFEDKTKGTDHITGPIQREKEAPGLIEGGPNPVKLLLDFTPYLDPEEVIKKLRELAKRSYRTVEEEAMYLIAEAVNRLGAMDK